MAGAEAIATKFARHKQQRYGGHINITKTFAISIFRRMGFVKRKGTKGVKHLPADWLHQRRVRQQSQQRYQRTQHSRLISNQLGPDRVPGGDWTMEQQGSQQVSITRLDDKRQITLLLPNTKSGALLPPQVIYPGNTDRCPPTTGTSHKQNITGLTKKQWYSS